MDKIDLIRWEDYFGENGHTLLYANDRYSETISKFTEERLLTGSMRILTSPGLTLTDLHVHSPRPIQLLDSSGKEGAESLFVIKGNVESSFDAWKDPLRFSNANQSIQYNTNFSGSHIIQSNEFHALTITYDLGYLDGLLQSCEKGSLQNLAKSIRRKENFLSMPYSMSVSGRIAEVIHAIQSCPFQGLTRYIFIESKMMELFVLQMEQLDSIQQASPAEKWSRLDREKLQAVKEYLESAYLEAISLKELTYKFGLNEFKLKKGFKDLFQTTVFAHLHHLRMQKAKALLREGEMNVAEVAFYIGYENVSSFSTEFKKRFGCKPSMAAAY